MASRKATAWKLANIALTVTTIALTALALLLTSAPLLAILSCAAVGVLAGGACGGFSEYNRQIANRTHHVATNIRPNGDLGNSIEALPDRPKWIQPIIDNSQSSDPAVQSQATARLIQWKQARDTLRVWQKLASQIQSHAPDLQNLSSLEVVLARADEFAQWVKDHKQELDGIRHLDLSNNRLTTVPDAIGQLTALISLDLSNNRLIALPGAISQLTALRSLGLSNNQLTTLPGEIGQLTALELLFLSDNRLTELPRTIGQLTALTQLYLSHNQLTELPRTIGQLTALKYLALSNNQLTTVPNEIGQPIALEVLSLSDNPLLTSLPASLANLHASARIDVTRHSRSAQAIQNVQEAIATARQAGMGRGPTIIVQEQVVMDLENAPSLEEAARFWLDLFRQRLPTQELKNDILSSLPSVIDGDQADLLIKFLCKLQFVSDFPRTQTQDNVISRACRMLEGACTHEEFRKRLFDILLDASESCADRTALAFNQIELAWLMYCNPMNEVGLAKLGIGAKRLELLQLLAIQTVASDPQRYWDPIEVHLYYQVHLREALHLPITTEGMHFGVAISGEQLRAVKDEVLSKTSSFKDIAQILAQSDVWREWLTGKHGDAFTAIDTRFSDETKQVIGDETRAAQLAGERDTARHKLSLELTEQWMREHLAELGLH